MDKEKLKDILKKEGDKFHFNCLEYHCVGFRNEHGAWCGYVGLKSKHPAYGMGYKQKSIKKLDVHGGVTFTGFYKELHDLKNIWWVGFDCCHSGDLIPKINNDGIYRRKDWVRNQIMKLANQLKHFSYFMEKNEQ